MTVEEILAELKALSAEEPEPWPGDWAEAMRQLDRANARCARYAELFKLLKFTGW